MRGVGKDNDSEESLIYRTFKNDGDPRKAFISMWEPMAWATHWPNGLLSIAINSTKTC